MDREALWCRVLVAKYGEALVADPGANANCDARMVSIWWKDLMRGDLREGIMHIGLWRS